MAFITCNVNFFAPFYLSDEIIYNNFIKGFSISFAQYFNALNNKSAKIKPVKEELLRIKINLW